MSHPSEPVMGCYAAGEGELSRTNLTRESDRRHAFGVSLSFISSLPYVLDHADFRSPIYLTGCILQLGRLKSSVHCVSHTGLEPPHRCKWTLGNPTRVQKQHKPSRVTPRLAARSDSALRRARPNIQLATGFNPPPISRAYFEDLVHLQSTAQVPRLQ